MRQAPFALLAAGFVAALLATSCRAQSQSVRRPVVAGAFYPSNPTELRETVDRYLAQGAKKASVIKSKPIALIVPHAGYRYSGACAGVAYATIKGRKYKRVIIMAVNHRGGPFHGASILDVRAYRTPLGEVPLDTAVCNVLRRSDLVRSYPSAHRREHSLEVQLPFLQRTLGDFKLVPIVMGMVYEEEFADLARTIRQFIDNDTLVIASSDFCHYGPMFNFAPFGTGPEARPKIEELDKEAVRLIIQHDGPRFWAYLRKTGDTICGRYPIRVLLHMLPADAKGHLLEYYASGDTNHDYRHSVSYAAIAFTAEGGWGEAPAQGTPGQQSQTNHKISPAGQRKLLAIARQTLVAVTAGKPVPRFQLDDPELQGRNGVFVTLHKNGQLRGCIGNFRPLTPLYQTVAEQTRMSALKDPRFPPVRPEEVKDIDIEISVLMPPRPINDPLDWEFGKHGIIVRRGWRQATFLPQVAKHFKNKQEMLAACCAKAGLLPHVWRDPGTKVLIYTAQVFGEKEPPKETRASQ